VETLGNFQPTTARAAGVKGLAIKLYDATGNPYAEENYTRLVNGDADNLRSLGFSLGAWACPRYAPEETADDVSAIYRLLRLSFAIFETEWEYKTDGGKVDVARLVTAWRALRPKAYTGFAVEGGPPTTFNHAVAIADPNSYLCPENYWLQNSAYDVRASLAQAAALGWPLERVKPTLTGVEGHDFGEALVRLMRAYEGKGVLLWRGDMLTPAQYQLHAVADTIALR
jgi:hypothetical protein